MLQSIVPDQKISVQHCTPYCKVNSPHSWQDSRASGKCWGTTVAFQATTLLKLVIAFYELPDCTFQELFLLGPFDEFGWVANNGGQAGRSTRLAFNLPSGTSNILNTSSKWKFLCGKSNVTKGWRFFSSFKNDDWFELFVIHRYYMFVCLFCKPILVFQ